MSARCFFTIALLLTASANTTFAQKDARAAAAATPTSALAPRGLYAAQTEPRSITLSWYAAALPSGWAGAQHITCTIGGRPSRPSQVSMRKQGPGVQTEPMLQTYVLPVSSEDAHKCALELRTRATGKGDEQVTSYLFNTVTPKLTPVPPAAPPTDVVARLISPGRVRLTWSASTDVTAVQIQRRSGREGMRTICFMCPPIGVYMDSVSLGRHDTSVQYAVITTTPGGRSRPALSRDLQFDARSDDVVATEPPASLPSGVVVTDIAGGAPPAAGEVIRKTVQESEKSVTQIIRLGPVAQVPQHHHPNHSETVVVHAGEVEVMIGSQRQFLRAGHVAHIPAGTTMSVLNVSRVNEAQLVAVFSSMGTAGPLMVPGPRP